MQSAPSLLQQCHSELVTLSLPASVSPNTDDAVEDGKESEEGCITSNVFASLMPNLFGRLQRCNETVSEEDFQRVTRLLDSAGSEDDVIQGNPFFGQACEGQVQERAKSMPAFPSDAEKEDKGLENKQSVLIQSDDAVGKENTSPNNPPQRNKLSRRERSSRIATHRKPFVVDIRSFGSVLNSNALGKSEKPQDVHAFWEAADEREASEAIMDKLKGRHEARSGSGTTCLRRLGVRRKNSQRTTTRLKRFAVELPSCAEQVQQLYEEPLEEEEDTTEESSFTFLSNLGFRVPYQPSQQEDAKKQGERSQLLSPDPNAMDTIYLDEVRHSFEEEFDILSDGKSPADVSDLQADASGCSKLSETSEALNAVQNINPVNYEISPVAFDLTKIVMDKCDAANVSEMKATPCSRNTASKITSFTSPTPPSNPLATFELGKDTAVEELSKRRLEFDDSMDPPDQGFGMPSPVIQNMPAIENTPLQRSPLRSEARSVLALKEAVEPPKVLIPEVPVHVEVTEHIEQIAMKPLTRSSKVKKPINIRRNSLEGAGMIWEKGQRRSTRIKSRPLEWWRGERFLVGRVHKSLATVIGIKYSSPHPCLPVGSKVAPKLKVKSFVSEEYSKYVQFAALG